MQARNSLEAVRGDADALSAKGGHHARILFMAAWFGLLTGLAELSLLAVKKFFLHRTIGLSPHAVWMVPLATLLFFAVVGLFLSLLAWRRPRLVSSRVAAFIFTFLSLLSVLLMYPPLHLYAKLLLAAGLAVQVARLLTARSKKFQALIPRTSGAMVGLILSLGIGVHGWQVLTEYVASAKLPPAAPNAPNVILITLDTVRAKSLSVYGHSRQTTPNLERLARRGVLFEQAMSPTSWTLPSHASMFTGRLPHELSVTWDAPLGVKYQTLAESLSGRGYATAGFAANHLYCSYEHGLDRGFAHYEDYEISLGEVVQSSSIVRAIANNYWLRDLVGNYELFGRKKAPELNASFLRWLSRQKGRPFFAFLNYYDAHGPYLPPEPFSTKFAPADRRGNPWLSTNWNWSPQDIQAELNAYEASIAYLDHHLGLLFDELQKQGVLDNTLVIVTSDHGEEFGEHGLMGHGSSLYLQSLHVPLLISFPTRVPEGKIVRNPVNLSDIPATVADLLGIDRETHFPGTTFARHWDATSGSGDLEEKPLVFELDFAPNLPLRYPVSKGDMRSLLVGRYYYIKNGDGHEELYDLENDPSQKHDLVLSGKAKGDLERFRAALEQFPRSSDQHQTKLLP